MANNFHSKLVETTQAALQEYYNFSADQIGRIETYKKQWSNDYYIEQLKGCNVIIKAKYEETEAKVKDSYKEFEKLIETKLDNALSYPEDYKLLSLENLTEREAKNLYQRNRDNYLFVGALNKYCKEHNISFIGKPTTDVLPELLDTYQRNFKHFLTPFNAANIAKLNELQHKLDIYNNHGVFSKIDDQIAEQL